MGPPYARSSVRTRLGSSSTRASAKPDAPDLVRKILLLEQSQGFRNRSVIGGVEPFVRRAMPGATAEALAGYEALASPERQLRVQQALRTLVGPPVAPPPSPAPPARPATPAAEPSPPVVEPGLGGPAGPSAALPAEAPTAKAPRRRASPVGSTPGGTGLDTPVLRLLGVGPSNARRLDRLGIRVTRDLLFHFPHRHVDYSSLAKVDELRPGELVTVVVTVWDVGSFPTRRGLERIEAVTGDETGNLIAVWFRRRDYFGSKLRGRQVVLSGKVESRNGRLYLNDPEIEFLEQADLVNTARLVPVYHLTEGLNQRWLRNLARGAVERYAPMVEEHMPALVRRRHGLVDLPAAIAQMHFPDDDALLARARRRLAFDELFMIQLGVAQRRQARQRVDTAPLLGLPSTLRAALEGSLPFDLTGAQRRVVDEILADLSRRQPMGRLLQGDVGAGKTIVAAIAMLGALANGHQAALMAPTEILAEQHGRTIAHVLDAPGVRAAFEQLRGRPGPEVGMLTGSTSRAQRRPLLEAAANGKLDVLVGTHALIQGGVAFDRLGLAVVDEQHRFGVLQRGAIRQKGDSPHLLVMTATPIPRTLALTLYGELDVSVIDELPPGRRAIKTRWVAPAQREGAYEFVRKQVRTGRQAFVVCPLVEESENVAARAATAEMERLTLDVFPELRLGLMHGRMKSVEKDEAMRRFRAGETQILVATTVIEVGIDVPNATVMLIEGADRFGLAQLHQLRGRVGRGADQSYCILLSEGPSLDGEERLRVIETTTDGFKLAEEDLRIRGPGEFLGTRQSGLPDLKVASFSDVALIEEARQAAFELVERDPELREPDHLALKLRLAILAERATDAD